jgi:hypothetical protein
MFKFEMIETRDDRHQQRGGARLLSQVQLDGKLFCILSENHLLAPSQDADLGILVFLTKAAQIIDHVVDIEANGEKQHLDLTVIGTVEIVRVRSDEPEPN